MIVGISKNTEIKDVYTNMIVGISKNTEIKDVYTNMIVGISKNTEIKDVTGPEKEIIAEKLTE
jgi:hypothetical protein